MHSMHNKIMFQEEHVINQDHYQDRMSNLFYNPITLYKQKVGILNIQLHTHMYKQRP